MTTLGAVVVMLVGAAPVTMLAPGPQSGSAVKGKSTKGWLVLSHRALAPAQVSFVKSRHPIDDDGKPEKVMTGVDVKVNDEGPLPLMLVSGLQPKKTLEPLAEEWPSITQGSVKLGAVTLYVERRGAEGHELVMRLGDLKQTLYAQDEGDLDGWRLRWAGDLDGDGKPDLLLDAANHYNTQTTRLFLSSRAKKGELVHEVATLSVTGC